MTPIVTTKGVFDRVMVLIYCLLGYLLFNSEILINNFIKNKVYMESIFLDDATDTSTLI